MALLNNQIESAAPPGNFPLQRLLLPPFLPSIINFHLFTSLPRASNVLNHERDINRRSLLSRSGSATLLTDSGEQEWPQSPLAKESTPASVGHGRPCLFQVRQIGTVLGINPHLAPCLHFLDMHWNCFIGLHKATPVTSDWSWVSPAMLKEGVAEHEFINAPYISAGETIHDPSIHAGISLSREILN